MRERAIAANDSPTSAALPAATPALLGGLSAAAFLAGFWQKDALLVRNALPNFSGLFDAPQLFALAARDGVESRIVMREGKQWTLALGPFRRSDFSALPERNWTLLLQGVNVHFPAADALLRRF